MVTLQGADKTRRKRPQVRWPEKETKRVKTPTMAKNLFKTKCSPSVCATKAVLLRDDYSAFTYSGSSNFFSDFFSIMKVCGETVLCNLCAINTKNYWKWKRRLCVKLFEVTNTTWDNLQIATHKSVSFTLHMYWFVLCNLQIISGCVCHLEQLHAQSPFLFPIVFGINLIPFFDICSVLAVLSPGLFGFVLLYLGRCAVATVAVCGFGRWFWCFTAGCHVKSLLFPGSPNPLSNRRVLHDWRKHTRPSTFHNPMLSANKHVVQICHSSQSVAVQTVQVERRTSPFNGIESSLRRAVAIKTKSLPISATTFPTALSLYIAHDGRKHKDNSTLREKARCTNLPLLAIGCRRWPCRRFRWALNLAFQRRRTKRKWHWKIAQLCRSPTVSARLHYHVSNSVVFVHRAGTLAKGYPLAKLFSKAEPFPFEKEININLVYSSCLKHANETVLGDPRQAHQRTQSLHFPSSFINHSTIACCSSAQTPSSLSNTVHENSTGSERVDALGLRAVEVIICMITRDFSVISIDVTGVSLSLSPSHKSHSRTI